MNSLIQRKNLMDEIISLIVESLGLDHLNRGELNEQTPLMGAGLELDSIDILELVVNIDEKYGLKIKNSEEGNKIFRDIGSLVDFIDQNASPT